MKPKLSCLTYNYDIIYLNTYRKYTGFQQSANIRICQYRQSKASACHWERLYYQTQSANFMKPFSVGRLPKTISTMFYRQLWAKES